MNRNTVARLLASGKPPRYRREPAGLRLDPFKDAVLEMLGKDASVPATVIRGHLRRQGYGGGITILKEYVAGVRPQFKAARDYGRTTYAAGEQAFSAWAEIFGDPVAVAALVDRLVHHAEVLVLRGEGYRLKGKGKEVLQGDERG